MIEIYIRSQNKEKLYRLGGNYACIEYGEYEDIKRKRGASPEKKKRHTICISNGCLEELGEYASKERCIEILDEIKNTCLGYVKNGSTWTITGGTGVQTEKFNIQRFYQMPEE